MEIPPKKKISIVTGCYNEEGNIEEYYRQVKASLVKFPNLDHEILVADNCSVDRTRDILRRLAAEDPKLKVYFNSRNFGPITSGYNVFLQATGDAVILMACDLQDPPALIPDLLRKWEEGFRVVVMVKKASYENPLMFLLRKTYYRALEKLSGSGEVITNFTGYGLYDRVFLNVIRRFPDPIPYLRGFVTEAGFRRAEIPFDQPGRHWGRSKHTLFSLCEVAMGGLINHSRLPLRFATASGFAIAGISLIVAMSYLIYKLLYWNTFTLGLAPLIIGVFFFSAVQLIFIGIVGEYVGAILTQVKKRPYAVIEETINCPNPDA
jgi:polyisoprenyl-phosphate glycosyltransferase